MDDEVGPVPSPRTEGADDGVGAVLYGMFTSFTEVLGELEDRLAAIEAAVRAGPTDLDQRLGRLEESLGQLSELVRSHAESAESAESADRAPGAGAEGQEAEVAALADLVQRRTELLDQRTAELATAVASVQALLQAHADETAHSLGRRAGEAGRRLAGDLGLRGRQKPPPAGP